MFIIIYNYKKDCQKWINFESMHHFICSFFNLSYNNDQIICMLIFHFCHIKIIIVNSFHVYNHNIQSIPFSNKSKSKFNGWLIYIWNINGIIDYLQLNCRENKMHENVLITLIFDTLQFNSIWQWVNTCPYQSHKICHILNWKI